MWHRHGIDIFGRRQNDVLINIINLTICLWQTATTDDDFFLLFFMKVRFFIIR